MADRDTGAHVPDYERLARTQCDRSADQRGAESGNGVNE
jgi:hypothetical protein